MRAGSLVAGSTAAAVLLQVGEGSFAFVSPIIAAQKRRSEGNLKFVMSAAAGEDPCEVIVVGSCNMDLMTYTPRLPSRGEAVASVAKHSWVLL